MTNYTSAVRAVIDELDMLVQKSNAELEQRTKEAKKVEQTAEAIVRVERKAAMVSSLLYVCSTF